MVLLTHLVLGARSALFAPNEETEAQEAGDGTESAAGSEPQKQLVDRARFLHVGFRKYRGSPPTLLWPRGTPSSPPGRSVAQSPS